MNGPRLLVELEREADGRWIAEVLALPTVQAYGSTREEAVARAEALALRVLAERLEQRETVPRLTLSSGDELVLQPSANGAAAGWLVSTLRGLADALSLPPNWNSYGAKVVEAESALAALRLLLQSMRPDSPAPRVVPTPRGGIHLEWNMRGIDLEVEPLADRAVYVYYDDERTPTTWEKELCSDLAPLADAIAELSRRS